MRGRMGAWEHGGTEFCASAEPANRLPSLRCDCPAGKIERLEIAAVTSYTSFDLSPTPPTAIASWPGA